VSTRDEVWPSLALNDWRDTCTTLHMWTQVIGKIRLARAPMMNHWWQVPLYVTSRGLTTTPMPHGRRTFQIDFDFVAHELEIATSDGARGRIALTPRTVAEFYRQVMATLQDLGYAVKIWTHPVEVENPVRFDTDVQHASYDASSAHRFWRMLVQADRLMTRFRSRFIGKCSPVHFFWGSFDMAVTRFSGRRAPVHPGGIQNLADWVTRESYSHECSSCGFWPGNDAFPEPTFYAYAYPEPAGFDTFKIDVEGASFTPKLREFVLPYEVVRRAEQPDELLLRFFQRTYEAAAELGNWDRQALERPDAG
jgi:hypothetical protein